MPVEVSLKKMTQKGRKCREIDVETFSIDHQASMTVLDLKKAVERKVNENHTPYGFHVFGEGELDVKMNGQCLGNDTVINEGAVVDVVVIDMMLHLNLCLDKFSKTEQGKKAQEAWEEALRGSDASASSEPPVPEIAIDQNAPSSPAVEGRTDGLRKISVPTMYGTMEVDAYVITYIQNMPHVSTYYGVYQVSKHFTQTRNCLFLNQDEEEERVPSADDASSADEIETVDDREQSVPVTPTTVPAGEALDTITEPEAEVEGAHFALTVADRRTAITQVHHITSAPNVSLAKLRDRIVKDVLGLTLGQTKDCNFTRARDETIIANFRPHVKSMLVDGDEVIVTTRVKGGAKQTKKDKETKDETFKKFLLEEKKKAIAVSAQKMTNMTFSDDVKTVMDDVKTKAEAIYMEAQQNPKMAMVRLLREMNLEALKDLTNYNTNKSDTRAESICSKMMEANLSKFAKIVKDFENAKETAQQVFSMVFTANFYKNNSNWDWKSFEKLVDVEVGIKETSVSLPSQPVPTTGDQSVNAVADALRDTRMEWVYHEFWKELDRGIATLLCQLSLPCALSFFSGDTWAECDCRNLRFCPLWVEKGNCGSVYQFHPPVGYILSPRGLRFIPQWVTFCPPVGYVLSPRGLRFIPQWVLSPIFPRTDKPHLTSRQVDDEPYTFWCLNFVRSSGHDM